ncbi:MAG: 3-oxoacyl-[acyl-carrier-protein] synthase, partial [Thermoleophilaceae bacterium]|nr:3-oxoacyl-[acyl-carrier-protein] synthase [Thermoleophilaceae bacterium]
VGYRGRDRHLANRRALAVSLLRIDAEPRAGRPYVRLMALPQAADVPRQAHRERAAATVAAVATALPERVVANAVIAERIGVDERWIESRTGVRERRFASGAESLTGLATRAGRAALDRAGVEAGALDLVVVATFTQDDLLPNTAPLVAKALGATRAGAFDVGSACTGFLAALALACGQVEAGRADHVLVIGAEVISRFVDHDDRRTAALFGDGAGAVVVSAGGGGEGGIGPVLLRCDGGGARHIHATRADALIRMDGHETFKFAVASLAAVTAEALDGAGLGVGDVDLFVFHQANGRILTAVGDKLGLPEDRVVRAIGTLGNTSSASIPLALAHAEADGALSPGATVLLAAFGAGFTWGAATLTWGAGDA